MGSLPRPHFVIFPFMSQGHLIPVLYLARLLRRRSAAVTLFTTPANAAPIRASLHDAPDISVLELPFSHNIPGVPAGVENTRNLPSMDAFLPFAKSTKSMKDSFDTALRNLPTPVSCIISDFFLGWTIESAKLFRVPRFMFDGMGHFSPTMYAVLGMEKPHRNVISLDEPFVMPGFGDLKVTRNDFDPQFSVVEPAGEYVEFIFEQLVSAKMSSGVIVNSFYEMEASYADYWNEKLGPKAVSAGPLCMAAPPPPPSEVRPNFFKFLDEKLAEGSPVLYVAFGTQAEVSAEQLEEIAVGLERSAVNFLWVLKKKGSELLGKFSERTKDRGLVIEDWVDQLQILNHGGVKGFLSHCGWNSVTEAVSAGVPIIAMPFMAEQHMNARFVADVARVGMRMMPETGSVRGLVRAAEVERVVRELMVGGEEGEAVRRNVAEYAAAAREALSEGGSSTRALGKFIEEVINYN